MMMDFKVKNKIKSIRHKLEIDSQVEFAKALGYKAQQINRWERQEEQPSIKSAFAICRAVKDKYNLDVKLDDIYECVEEPTD